MATHPRTQTRCFRYTIFIGALIVATSACQPDKESSAEDGGISAHLSYVSDDVLQQVDRDQTLQVSWYNLDRVSEVVPALVNTPQQRSEWWSNRKVASDLALVPPSLFKSNPTEVQEELGMSR